MSVNERDEQRLLDALQAKLDRPATVPSPQLWRHGLPISHRGEVFELF